jgi:hypothetical protein
VGEKGRAERWGQVKGGGRGRAGGGGGRQERRRRGAGEGEEWGVGEGVGGRVSGGIMLRGKEGEKRREGIGRRRVMFAW